MSLKCVPKNDSGILDGKFDGIFQILNENGSWRKLAEMWDCAFIVSHAEDAKNPARYMFNCAEVRFLAIKKI